MSATHPVIPSGLW